MRHAFANKKLNRTSEHRKALLKNMLNSLIKYEQIKTTLPKAKFLKPQADKIITLGKKDSLQTTKRLVSQLQDIKSANKVKKTLSKRYEKRSGGYTRIIKAGFRYGDNAPMAIIEFVDRDVEAKRVDRKKKDTAKETDKKETDKKEADKKEDKKKVTA
jgi:large subunit ribosomal protein L17